MRIFCRDKFHVNPIAICIIISFLNDANNLSGDPSNYKPM